MQKERGSLQVMASLVGLVRPLLGYMHLAILLGVLGFCCSIFLTIFGGFAMLNILGMGGGLSLSVLFACVFGFAILRGLLRYGEQGCNHYIAFKLLARIRDQVFGALRRLCPAKLEGRDRGDLISIITSDIELLEVFYAHTLSPVAIATIMSVIMVLWIGRFHWLLGLLAAAAYLVVGVAVPVATSKFGGRLGLEYRTQAGSLAAFVLDSLRGLGETIQYGAGEQRLEDLQRRTVSLSQKEEAMKGKMGTSSAATGALVLLFSLGMLALSSWLYTQGQVAFDGVLIPLISLMSSFGPVVALANLGSKLQQTIAAGNRVLNILEEEPLVEENTQGIQCTFQDGQCSHVTFSYGQEEILRDVSLTLSKNQIVGITGKSGSGKSTLLKLLMRFWDVQQGEIRLSDVPIQQIQTDSLRRMEGYVTQETDLFHDSIENNVKIAKPHATRQEVIDACKKASVHDFIVSLPQGYDTNVGELGDTLSGGERQRLGVARAFLHDAPLLLLDEPTSNLDSLNEAVILKSLYEQRQGKTIVLVSHRSSTMRIVQECYQIQSGRMS